MKSLFLIIAVLFASQFVNGQVQYGSPSELRGLSVIFIDADSLKDHDAIKAAIVKAKLKVTFVEAAEESQIVLGLKSSIKTKIMSTNGDVDSVEMLAGRGTFYVFGKKAMRIVLEFESVQNWRREKRPAVKFVAEFIKAWKKANEN